MKTQSDYVEWLKAERQFLSSYLQQAASLVNQRIVQIDEELARSEKEADPVVAPKAMPVGPEEADLERLTWQGPSKSGWYYMRKADVPLAVLKAAESWGRPGLQGTKWHYFVARDGNLLKKERET